MVQFKDVGSARLVRGLVDSLALNVERRWVRKGVDCDCLIVGGRGFVSNVRAPG